MRRAEVTLDDKVLLIQGRLWKGVEIADAERELARA